MAFNISYVYKAVDRFSRPADTISKSMTKIKARADSVSRSLDGVGTSMRNTGAKMTAFASLPIFLLGNSMIKAASDADEMKSRFDTVFDGVGKKATKASLELARDFNFSKKAANELIGGLGDFAQNLGFSKEKSLELSFGLNKLAADVKSFKNVNGGSIQVVRAFQSALVGEREALKTLDVAMTEADVTNQIAINRSKGLTFATTKQEKAMATIALLYKNFNSSIGDLNRTRESEANRADELAARYSDLSVQLGRKLIPLKLKLISITLKLIQYIEKLSPGTQKFIMVLLGLIMVFGPILGMIGMAILGISMLVKVFALSAAGVVLFSNSIAGLTIRLALWSVASKAAALGMMIFNAAMALNPIVWVVAAIMAAVAAIIYFRTEIGNAVESFLGLFNLSLPDWIKSLLNMNSADVNVNHKSVNGDNVNNDNVASKEYSINNKGEFNGVINIRADKGSAVSGATSTVSGGAGNLGFNMDNLTGVGM